MNKFKKKSDALYHIFTRETESQKLEEVSETTVWLFETC